MNRRTSRRGAARRRPWLIVLGGLAALALCSAAPGGDDDDDDDAAADVTVEVVDGRTRLHVDPDALQRFGIELAAPVSKRLIPERQVFGEVLDPRAIVELNYLIVRAAAARASASAILAAQRSLLARFDEMRERGLAVDTVELGRERRELQRCLADERTAGLELDAARARARQQWGPQLGARIAAGNDPLIDDLLSARTRLVSVQVRGADEASGVIHIANSGVRAVAVPGSWIGPAPRNLMPLGSAYLVTVANPDLRPGMRVSAWLGGSGKPVLGLLLPRPAVVWHVAKRWIYVELEPGLLERRVADIRAIDSDGVLIAAGEEPVRRAVVAGAQSLLGEELRWSIPDEDDD